MKKILSKIKQNIIGFILGSIIFGSVGVYATIKYNSNEISYKETTVEKALNDLYEEHIKYKYDVHDKIFSESGNTGGSLNSTYVNKNYTLTNENIAENYKFYLLYISTGGASNISYSYISSITVPENSIKLTNSGGNIKVGSSNHVTQYNKIYIIPSSENLTQIFNVTLQGTYYIELFGIK